MCILCIYVHMIIKPHLCVHTNKMFTCICVRTSVTRMEAEAEEAAQAAAAFARRAAEDGSFEPGSNGIAQGYIGASLRAILNKH